MPSTAAILEHPHFERAEIGPSGIPPVAAAEKPKRKLRKRLLIGLGLGVAKIAVLGYGYWALVAGHYVSTDNAYVGAPTAQINALVSAPVARVAVEDTQAVRAGDVLVTLDDSDARLALARAQADYQRTLQRVGQYFAQVSVAAAQVDARQSDLTRANDDYARRVALVTEGAISREQLSAARNAAEAARANLVAAQQTLTSQQELVRGVDVDHHPETIAARAALQKAELDLTRTIIRAPVDGIVAQRKVQVGQSVQPGQSLMTITPIDEAYVDANFKEGQLANVRVGQPVELVSDLYGDDIVYHGRVEGLGGGTGSAFAVIPAQNATGNWIKVVQRLPVRIALNKSEIADRPLRVGLSMTATIDTAN